MVHDQWDDQSFPPIYTFYVQIQMSQNLKAIRTPHLQNFFETVNMSSLISWSNNFINMKVLLLFINPLCSDYENLDSFFEMY